MQKQTVLSNMRLSSIFTLLCCIGALVLSVLCLVAGSTRSFLQNGDILTVNMSRLGYVDTGSNNSGGGFLDTLINDAESELGDLAGDVISDIASALNIPDFFSVHIMDYCQGMYEPNATLAAVGGKSVSKNTTYCSPQNSLFHFNITEVVENALPSQISLGDIQWPSEVTDAQNLIRTASIAISILYILSVAFSGLAVIGALFGIFTNGRMSACCNVIIDLLAFLALAAGSIVATIAIVKAVDAVNKYGKEIGISATRGTLFMGMTWAGTALMLIATIVSIVQLIRGRKNGGYISERKEKHRSGY